MSNAIRSNSFNMSKTALIILKLRPCEHFAVNCYGVCIIHVSSVAWFIFNFRFNLTFPIIKKRINAACGNIRLKRLYRLWPAIRVLSRLLQLNSLGAHRGICLAPMFVFISTRFRSRLRSAIATVPGKRHTQRWTRWHDAASSVVSQRPTLFLAATDDVPTKRSSGTPHR